MLCLQEKDGRFPNVDVYRPANIELTCTRSGLFTESIYFYWTQEVLSNSIDQDSKTLYIADSWAPHKNIDNYSTCMTENFNLQIIPPSTTAFAQPLDLYFNRQLKNLCRYTVHVLKTRYDVDSNVFQRNSVIRLISFVDFQLRAPIFTDMIRYCFLKPGIISGESRQFKSVNDVCKTRKSSSCSRWGCQGRSSHRCSWCDELFCAFCMSGEEKRPHMQSCRVYSQPDEEMEE